MMLFFINLVDAISISGIYSNKNPLEISPGESKTIDFILQNMAGDSDVKFEANITRGFEIARLDDNEVEYLVPLGSNDVKVPVLVKIPREADIGTEYQVKIEFNPLPMKTEGEGMVQIAVGLAGYFKVNIVEKTEDAEERISMIWIIFWIMVALIVMVFIWLFYEYRKKQRLMPFK